MLFFKECGKVVFSLTFLLYAAVVFVMYVSQFQGDLSPIAVPNRDIENYGYTVKEIPEQIMPKATERLVDEYLSGYFTAYPTGFYKEVRLSKKKKAEMAEIITEITGLTREELDSYEDYSEGGYYMDESGQVAYTEAVLPVYTLSADLDYEHFRELMRRADKLIGGGSKYGDSEILGNFSRVPRTYEDAAAEYNTIMYEQKITPSYARLFCDYMGIAVSVMPVFCAVFITALDKKSRMEQLINSRRISSARLIFTRYAALVFVMTVPIFIAAVVADISVRGLYPDAVTDRTAFYRYAAAWLIPNVMTAAAAGMLFTELLSGIMAIFIQGAWWMISIMSAANGLTGDMRRFTLVLRHNSLYALDEFAAEFGSFVFNRLFFTAASLAAVGLAAAVYDIKRRNGSYGLGDLKIGHKA